MHFYLDGLPIKQRTTLQFNRHFQEYLNKKKPDLVIHINEVFNNQVEAVNHLNTILLLQSSEEKCTLTISCHGEEKGLKVNNERELIEWKILVPLFLRLKKKFTNLIIILCVCEGTSIGILLENAPFIFGFTYKISPKLAIETASLIIVEYINNVPLDNILQNARKHVKDNEDLITLT